MTSFCIKTNNKRIINYLLKQFEYIELDQVYISNRVFKIYENVIIHYLGNDISSFYNAISNILSNCIINFYEKKLLKKIININYFYFNYQERKEILDSAIDLLKNDTNNDFASRKQDLCICCLKYLYESKSIILDGFVNFRIANYIESLDYAIDTAVNKFLIEREYSEFITLLKLYISSKPCQIDTLHLIYSNKESILIDDNKNIISVEDNIFNAKYLSDITFSSNDYALNTLLTLLPKKVIIHLIDNIVDEFINTLKLIFEDRIYVCTDCSICKTYKMSSNKVIIKE